MLDTGVLGELLGDQVAALEPVHGGDVARSYRVALASGSTVFAKTHPDPPPGFFTTESWGLEWLRGAETVAVPRVLAVSDDPPLLALTWIDEGARAPQDEAAFGRALAELHQAGAPCFGREDRRTTGSRGLPNVPCATWAEFYATQRLLPLVKLARDDDVIAPSILTGIEELATRLDRFGGADETPARLHGDLWAGNRIVDTAGESWLIDPACHGGHREFDLAMMRLFGGFGAAAFHAYHEVSPLADGWQSRIALHQLAPLLVHAIKFGGGYVGSVTTAVELYG